MPNDNQPRKKRRRHLRIGHGAPVRVTAPGWVYLNADGRHITYTADAVPLDPATATRLQFPPNDNAG